MNWAPTVFTKCMRPVIALIRTPLLMQPSPTQWLITSFVQNFAIIYLDDLLVFILRNTNGKQLIAAIT